MGNRKRKRQAEPSPATRWWLPAGVVGGAIAFTAQQLLLRELLVIHSENALFAGIALGSWLLLGGVASLAARGREPWTERRALLALAAVGLAVPVSLVACRGIWWLNPTRATAGAMVLITLVVQAPCAILSGLLFAGLARGRPDAPRVLAAECLGAVLGLGLLLTARSRCVAPAALALVTALVALAWCAARARARAAWSALVLATGCCALALAPGLERATLEPVWYPLEMVFSLDTSWSRVSVLRKPKILGGTLRFYVNRFPMWAIEDDAGHNEGLVHLPLLLHPAPRRVLIVGGGVGGNAREALLEPVSEVVLCELEPAVLAAGRWIFHRENRGALSDPRLVARCMDGGRFLLEDEGQFDAILLDLPDPYLPQLARFYSKDFLELAGRRLRPGGLVAIQLPRTSAPDGPIARANRVLARTFRAAFPQHVTVFGRMDYFVGFNGPAPSPDRMLDTLEQRQLPLRAVTAELLLENRSSSPARQARLAYLDVADGAEVSTDDRPVALGHDLYFWESVGNRGVARIPDLASRLSAWQVAALLAFATFVCSLVAGRAAGAPVAALVFAAGLLTQALGTLLLYQLQTRVGTLLATAPLLGAAALAGHGIGALVPQTTCASRALSLALAVLGALLPALMWSLPSAACVPVAAAGVALAGLFAGALWSAGLRNAPAAPPAAGRWAARLYGADLCGAALAAFLLLPIALPFAGVTASALAMAGVLALLAATGR